MTKKLLFILSFDHRRSFGQLTKGSPEKAKALKQIIYQGFKMAVEKGCVPKEEAAILVDEQFGGAILEDAAAQGYTTCLAVEKSGQDEFDFEYGDNFGEHINKYRPTFVKALIRNSNQKDKLKKLNDFCKKNNYRFLLELLAPKSTIKELQAADIEPDIWKIEGSENPRDYQDLTNAVILGRGANDELVEKWLRAGAKAAGIVGFAIGRTIFWQALVDYQNGKINQEAASRQIADKYRHFYRVFINAKT